MTTIEVPGLPIAQPRAKHAVVGGFSRTYTPKKKKQSVQDYKATIRITAQEHAEPALFEQGTPIELSIVFVMPRPSNQYWKTKPTPSYPHTKKPDADNLAKAVKDALTGVIWRDDSQVCDMRVVKRVASGDELPRTIISWGLKAG